MDGSGSGVLAPELAQWTLGAYRSCWILTPASDILDELWGVVRL